MVDSAKMTENERQAVASSTTKKQAENVFFWRGISAALAVALVVVIAVLAPTKTSESRQMMSVDTQRRRASITGDHDGAKAEKMRKAKVKMADAHTIIKDAAEEIKNAENEHGEATLGTIERALGEIQSAHATLDGAFNEVHEALGRTRVRHVPQEEIFGHAGGGRRGGVVEEEIVVKPGGRVVDKKIVEHGGGRVVEKIVVHEGGGGGGGGERAHIVNELAQWKEKVKYERGEKKTQAELKVIELEIELKKFRD